MIGSGLVRILLWTLLIIGYVIHVHFVRHLFSSISFVAILSVLALLLTDWAQVAASIAQLVAGDIHFSVHANQEYIDDLHADVGKLANLTPGPEAKELADDIKRKLHT